MFQRKKVWEEKKTSGAMNKGKRLESRRKKKLVEEGLGLIV